MEDNQLTINVKTMGTMPYVFAGSVPKFGFMVTHRLIYLNVNKEKAAT